MSNVAIFNPAANVPAFLKRGEMSAIAKALAGGGGGMSGKRISVKGGVFRLFADGKEVTAIDERYLDVVVVNSAPKVSRMFYAKAYDADAPSAPDCWSQNGDKPEESVPLQQSPTCANCPQNAKGSGQGDSRACRYQQRLAVVLANDMEGDVLQLSLAATSLFGKAEGDNRPLQEYARWLIAQGADPTALVTRLKFDTSVATPKLFFKAMRWLENDEYALCQERGNSVDAKQAITLTVAAMDGVAAPRAETIPGRQPKATPAPAAVEDAEPPAPPPRKAKAAALPPEEDEAPAPAPKRARTVKPTPAVQDEDDEPVARPTPVKAAAAVAPQGGVSKILAEWDDE